MKIDKTWLVAFFVFVGGLISKQFDLQLPDGYAEWAADAVMAVSAIVFGYRDMIKKSDREHPFDGGVTNVGQNQSTFSDHGPMV